MSHENVELVRRAYDGWAQGDFSEGGVFQHEVEFDMVDWPEQSTSHGLAAMRRTWQASLGSWDDFRAEASDFIDGDEYVVVLTHVRARGKGSGAEVSADTATVWTFDAGKVIRLALYWDSSKALEAVGLRE
jgi:ketosteroid isomerase-like protein